MIHGIRFGERIHLERKRLNLSLEALAKLAGMSKGFLCEVENGRKSMSVHRAKAIARVLRTSVDVLMEGEPCV